jgi:hypothetical protein
MAHAMISAMSVSAAIAREINDARATGYREIVHIRVTVDAIPGSVTTTPLTPERARVLGKLIAVDLGKYGTAVEADPYYAERLLEILIHPQDYVGLMKEADDLSRFAVSVNPSTGVSQVYGVPVSRR